MKCEKCYHFYRVMVTEAGYNPYPCCHLLEDTGRRPNPITQICFKERRIRTKQILFNTEMVKMLLCDQKTTTRRPIKPSPVTEYAGPCKSPYGNSFHDGWELYEPPYQREDVVYVRETWCVIDNLWNGMDMVIYKASYDSKQSSNIKWHPSIHMPKKAARIFLRVKNVFVQKIQDITDEQARAEGCKDRDDFKRVWNKCYVKPQPVKENGVVVRYESYPWEDIRESRTYRGLPWDVIGNPWVWVIEFERISKEEAGL